MNRRTFLKYLGIGAVTAVVNPEILLAETKSGIRVNAQDHGRHYRVYFNGKDISKDCYQADSGENWADIYLRDVKDSLVYNRKTDKVSSKRIYGNVEIVKT